MACSGFNKHVPFGLNYSKRRRVRVAIKIVVNSDKRSITWPKGFMTGKKIILQVSVWEGEKKVGTGTHERYLIEVVKFLEKLT